MSMISRHFVATMSMATLLAVPAAFAQGTGADFSTGKLEQYAQAQEEIVRISNKYRSMIESASDRDQATDLQQRANSEMVSAVRESGLSVEEYNAVTQAAQKDRELQARLESIRQEM